MFRREWIGPGLRAVAAGIIVCAVAGCSTTGTPTGNPAPLAATEAVPVVSAPAVAAPEEVTALLTMMIDPAVPTSEKVGRVQDGELDPGLPNRLAEATRQGGTTMTIVITSTREQAPGMTAAGTWTLNGSAPLPIIVNFVADDGVWKIEKAWYCQIAYSFMVASTACPT